MLKILILHGPDPEEITKALKLVRVYEDFGHNLVPLTGLKVNLKKTSISLSSFTDLSLGDVWLKNFISTQNGRGTISFAWFLVKAIDMHDKVVILPSHHVIHLESYIYATGYALGKNKVVATLNYSPVIGLPEWYEYAFQNIPSTKVALRHKLKKL